MTSVTNIPYTFCVSLWEFSTRPCSMGLQGPPRTSKLPSHSKQGSIFVHDGILKFRAPITPNQCRDGSAPEHAASEHAPRFHSVALRAVLQQNAMTQTTNVGHGILVSRFGRWIPRTFQVDHHFFPTFSSDQLNLWRWCLLGNFPEPQASNALLTPTSDIFLYVLPPCPSQD